MSYFWGSIFESAKLDPEECHVWTVRDVRFEVIFGNVQKLQDLLAPQLNWDGITYRTYHTLTSLGNKIFQSVKAQHLPNFSKKAQLIFFRFFFLFLFSWPWEALTNYNNANLGVLVPLAKKCFFQTILPIFQEQAFGAKLMALHQKLRKSLLHLYKSINI